MIIRGDGINFGRLRGLLVRLLLVSFVLRSLIPVGFMPDFAAASKGVFKVVICSASGSKTISVDRDGHKVPSDSSAKHDQPCAFAGLAVVALPALEPALPIAFATGAAKLIPHLAVTLPPTRAGPQLGSRGPPQLS